MIRRILVAELCIIMAVLVWQSTSAIMKAKPEILGYRIGDHSRPSEMESVEKRFGKTYMSEQFSHSSSPVYRTSDGKAYLIFGWADCGMETIIVASALPKGTVFPRDAKITRIALPSSGIRAGCGIALGDTQARVKSLVGLPTYSKKTGSETKWQYVDRWWCPRDAKRFPMTLLEATFIKGRVVRLWARCEEP